MAAILHLLKGSGTALPRTVIEQQLGAGDRVTVALLAVGAADLPAGVALRPVPGELSYAQLLDLIFESDQVIAW